MSRQFAVAGLRAKACRQLVAVHHRQADVEHRDLGSKRLGEPQRATGRRAATATSWPTSRSSSARHLRRVDVVVDHEDAPCRGGPGRQRPLGPPAPAEALRSPGLGSSGSRITNSLPLPGPSLRADDAAAVHRDQALARAPGPGPGRPRRDRRCGALNEQIEHPREQSGAIPTPLSSTRMTTDAAPRPSRARGHDDVPPGSVYRAALVSRFATTWASRTASPSTRSPSAARRRRVVTALLEQVARDLDRLGDRRRRARPALCAARSCPRVILRDVEQIVDQPHQVTDLALDDLLLAVGRDVAPQLHELERGDDRRQWVAQLVAQHGQELVLGPVRGLRDRRAASGSRPATAPAPAARAPARRSR